MRDCSTVLFMSFERKSISSSFAPTADSNVGELRLSHSASKAPVGAHRTMLETAQIAEDLRVLNIVHSLQKGFALQRES